jgi:hypothetical protein
MNPTWLRLDVNIYQRPVAVPDPAGQFVSRAEYEALAAELASAQGEKARIAAKDAKIREAADADA